MSIIKYALRKTLLTRRKGSTVPHTDTSTKNCHSIIIALITGQGRERWETAGFSLTPCLLPLKMNPGYFCRSLWLPISHSQFSFLGCKPCLVRKHLPFSKAKELRQQSTDTQQKGYQYRKSCSVFSPVNYAKFLLQSKISLLQLLASLIIDFSYN